MGTKAMIKILTLVMGIIFFISCQTNEKSKTVSENNSGIIQNYVKDRDDWKPNPGLSEVMILDMYAIKG